MSPLAMLPFVGVAAETLGRGLSSAVSESLSFAASLREGGIADEPPVGVTAAPTTAERQCQFDDALARFRSHLAIRLASAGLEIGGALELSSDGLGGIQIDVERSDRAAIEQAIAGDFALQQEFQALANQYAEQHPEFDPSDADFGLLVVGDRVQVAIAD